MTRSDQGIGSVREEEGLKDLRDLGDLPAQVDLDPDPIVLGDKSSRGPSKMLEIQGMNTGVCVASRSHATVGDEMHSGTLAVGIFLGRSLKNAWT